MIALKGSFLKFFRDITLYGLRVGELKFMMLTQLIIFLKFWAEILRISHPVKYSIFIYLPDQKNKLYHIIYLYLRVIPSPSSDYSILCLLIYIKSTFYIVFIKYIHIYINLYRFQFV